MNKQISKKSFISADAMRKIIYVMLLLILSIGFYLRIGGVLTNSFAFTYDVGRDMLEVQNIVETHKLPLIGQTTGLGGLYYGPWWYYILTPSFIVSNGNPQGVVFFMVLAGMAVIVLGYFLGLLINGRILGLTIAVSLAFSASLIGFSNQIWNPNLAPLFVLLVFIIIFSFGKNSKKNTVMKFLLGFLLGLILDSEIVFGVLFISGIFLVLLYILRKKLLQVSSIWILLGFLIILFPRIFFEFRHQFVMTKSLFASHSSDQQILDIGNFFTVLPDRINTLLSQMAGTFGIPTHIVLLLIISSAVFLIVYRKLIREAERKFIIANLIIFTVFVVGSCVFARAVWGHYLVGLPVIYILFASTVILIISRKSLVLAIIILAIFSYININPLQIIADSQKPLWEGNAAVYRNQLAVIDYVYDDAKGKNFNYIVYTPVVHDYTYQYLFSWYGKNKYGYIPDVKKENLFYAIIEEDPGYEGRIKDWLKVRENDGKIVGQRVVKGGITVQKRLH